MNIGIIGMGKLGLPVALAIEAKGHNVCGFDIDPRIKDILETRKLPYREKGAQELLAKTNIKIKSLYEVIKESEIIFVAIQTPNKEGYEGITRTPKTKADFDYSYLKAGIESLSKIINVMQKEKIVIIISTVLPGTIRREIKPFLNKYIKLCYNPFFIAMTQAIDDFLNPEFVLFGVDDEMAAQKTEEFYRTINNKKFVRMSIESAELTKMSYNTFITNKITIANTIMEISHKIPNCNCDDVMGALKLAKDRIVSDKYMDGGLVDSGGCHPKDLLSLSFLSEKLGLEYNLYDNLANIRDKQTEWLANLIIEKHKETNLPIFILGYTYKKETNLTIGSAAILLKNMLAEKGYTDIEMYDPCVDSGTINFISPALFFIGMNHDNFKNYVFPQGSVVIDPWRYLNKQDGVRLIKVGIGEDNG